jgi:hypothetical protein
MPEDVQPGAEAPAEGQGAEGTTGLYDLDSVPEELRSQLEPHLKAYDAQVTKKFQDAANYRQQWEPYEELGLNQYDPESVAGLLQFAQMAEDDNAFAQWFEQTGQESGLFEALGYQKAESEDMGDGFEGMNPEQIAAMVQEAVAQQMAPVNEQLTAQQQETLVREAEQEITDRLEQIKGDNPNLPEGADDAILRFAHSFAEDDEEDPIGKGFEEYQRIVSQGESGLFAQKAGQPGPVEGPGAASTSAEPITSFDQAKAAAKVRLTQSQST